MAIGVWDGRRPRTPRTVLAREVVSVGGVDFAFVTEQIDRPTDWCIQRREHTVVVHRAGRLRSLECDFGDGATRRAVPVVGDIWTIPSGARYAALAHGATVEFCEVRLPTTVIGDRPVEPAVKQRDPLIYFLVERMHALRGRDDVFARLLSESVCETFRLQFLERFVAAAGARPVRLGELDRGMIARLVEFLEDGLDAEVSVAAMARLVDMPISTFNKAFAVAFKMTPHQYLLNRRICRSKTLLATTTLSVTEISASVGFATPSHFATTFRNRVGLTPTAFRRHEGSGLRPA